MKWQRLIFQKAMSPDNSLIYHIDVNLGERKNRKSENELLFNSNNKL